MAYKLSSSSLVVDRVSIEVPGSFSRAPIAFKLFRSLRFLCTSKKTFVVECHSDQGGWFEGKGKIKTVSGSMDSFEGVLYIEGSDDLSPEDRDFTFSNGEFRIKRREAVPA